MRISPCSTSPVRFVFYLPALLLLLSLTIQPAEICAARPQGLLADAAQLPETGDLQAARGKYMAASVSRDRPTRLAGLIGLGRVYRRIPGKRMESFRQLRKAREMEPDNPEILYEIALTGFELKESSGAMIADNALTEIICQDPGYRDAYALWHGKIRGRSLENMEKVAECLPAHIARNPELSHLWLDIAYDWFELFKTENCLAALDSLLESAPRYKPQERLLLRARCLLALGDAPGFEYYYRQALRAAEREGDFSRLIAEAGLIFTPAEAGSLQRLKSKGQVATFFRVFWRNKDPDPVTFHNERLVEHYERLREAERNYRVLTPDGLVGSSDNYLRLMSRTTEFAADIGTAEYEYDPAKVFSGRAPDFNLDHRGLLFVRHGPPDVIEDIYIKDSRDGFVENLGKGGGGLDITNSYVWRYGRSIMIFKSGMGTGGYLYYLSVRPETADIERAMNTQTFKDPLPIKPQDYYSAAFHRADGRLDLEFYQSVPVSVSKVAEPPEARMALYDRSLNELARDSSISVAAGSPDGDVWLAVTSVPVKPDLCSFALSLALPEVRSAVKSNIRLEPIDSRELSLSGIVMGVRAEEGQGLYRRGQGELLPRPSLEFTLDELIDTFMEVYNLRLGRDDRREYVVSATIKLIEQDRNQVGKLLEKSRLLGQERGSELTMKFERFPPTEDSVVTERFSINASELIPGVYRLKIEIRDKSSGSRASAERDFKLVE